MPLPAASPQRQPRHHRLIDVQVFDRQDGLWEVDALLVDTKSREVVVGGRARPAGTPIHEMLLRLVVDRATNVIEAGSDMRWMPYPGQCDQHGDAYGRLVGLNLLNGFRHAVRQRLGGILGCTHLTELTQVLPTAVVQAFAGDVIKTTADADQQPFQLDGCHALRTDGPVVREHYPRWYRAPATHNNG